MATMLDESSPALKNAPIGTSLTICVFTELRNRLRISSATTSSDLGKTESDAGKLRSQYCVIFSSPLRKQAKCPAGSLWTPRKSVPGSGTHRNVRYCCKDCQSNS